MSGFGYETVPRNALQRDDDKQARANQAVSTGMVTSRELNHLTSHLLKAMETTGQGVLVTRYGRVVAELRPTSLRSFLDRTEDDSGVGAELDEADEQRGKLEGSSDPPPRR